ncbi:MAG: hypothetical protein MUO89_09230 [Dehalococcoidia bacterium]|nr:hypothetical protein [Dehalococcoidia bacterium]
MTDVFSEADRKQLEQELKKQEDGLVADFSGTKSVLDDGLKLIEKAKRAIDARCKVDAEIAIIALKARMAQGHKSKELLEEEQPKHLSLFWKLFLYDFLFLLIALAIGWLVVFGPVQLLKPPDDKLPPVWLASWLFLGFAAGMLGGVLISLYGLVKHGTAGDFDRSFIKWYWCKPLIGALSGSIAALPFLGGLFIFDVSNRVPILVTSIASVSMLAGFYERFFLQLIDRLGQVILTPGESKENSAK